MSPIITEISFLIQFRAQVNQHISYYIGDAMIIRVLYLLAHKMRKIEPPLWPRRNRRKWKTNQ